jgi:hypothetical protein
MDHDSDMGDLDLDVDDEDTSQGDAPRPFDPNQIRVRQEPYVVYNLMEALKAGDLDLAPEFQRKAGIWDPGRQSRLVESLLIRIPLPAFYLDELPLEAGQITQRLAVVDGVQRLTALDRFINKNEFRLSSLEFLDQLNGRGFEDLEPALKRRILEAKLVAYVVESGTPPAAKLNIFKRINTGGLSLTAQEIRHAMNPGPVRKFLESLGESDEFKRAVGAALQTKMSQRMQDRECALRFFAFLDGGVKRYRGSRNDFDGFLHDAMDRLNRASPEGLSALGARFRRSMKYAHLCLGRHAFRKPGAGGPMNKALFEATAVALDAAADDELEKLAQDADRVLRAYVNALTDTETLKAVSSATGDPARVDRRFKALEDVIREALK